MTTTVNSPSQNTLLGRDLGIVAPQYFECNQPLALKCGQELDHFVLAFETYGTLNADKSNGILICHALTGSHHVAGRHLENDRKPGWWDSFIGPGKTIDTEQFFVVCSNNLGGCHGSSGPTTVDLATSLPYGPDFPIVTVEDWVESQARLSNYLGIAQWYAIVGGSIGGMQVLQWSIAYPERLQKAVIIASAPKVSAQNIAFNEVGRQAILRDPSFQAGHYYSSDRFPRQGLAIARMLGHITYLSDDSMGHKFGRELKEGQIKFGYSPEFQVESYLRYQGETFSDLFDANSYLLLSKARDYFDPAENFENDLNKTLGGVCAHFLIVAFSSDWLFSERRSKEIVDALIHNDKVVSFAKIEAPQGHDSFLMDIPRYKQLLNAFLSTKSVIN